MKLTTDNWQLTTASKYKTALFICSQWSMVGGWWSVQNLAEDYRLVCAMVS